MIIKYFKRFPHAWRGITYGVKNDFGFRTQVYLGLVVGLGTTWLFWPLTINEIVFLALSLSLILITELQNSALEIALDQLHPELHESIGRSKDMAASAVLIAGLFLILVLGIITFNHLF